MAINIIHRPHSINPNSNLNTWVVSSDNSNLIYVLVEVIEPTSNGIITIKKVYPKPLQTNIQFNLSDVLVNIVEPKFKYSNSIIYNNEDLPKYKLKITEFIIDNEGNVIEGAVLNDQTINYFFDGVINPLIYDSYTSSSYNVNIETKAKFLSTEASVKKTRNNQLEFLKIFNTNGIGKKLFIQYYNNSEFLESLTIGLPLGDVVNLNVSPKIVLNYLSEEYLNNVTQYKIVVQDENYENVSESQLYQLVSPKCGQTQTNLIYKNSLGGWNSIMLFNRIENFIINKTYLENGNTVDAVNNIFNNSKKVISNTTQYSYSAFTDYLNDHESRELKELMLSDKVYLVHGNYFIEVLIDNKNYKVVQRLTNGGKKGMIDIQFTAPFALDLIDGISADAIDLGIDDNPISFITSDGNYVIDYFQRFISVK